MSKTCLYVKSHFTFFMSFEACENNMNSVVLCQNESLFSSTRRVSRPLGHSGSRGQTGQNWRSSRKVQTAYPSRLLTTCHLWACGDLDHNLIFLILAAFNSFLQMATTVGRIGLLLPGHCNMHVCLISHHREKDDAVQVVINLDFKKSPSVVDSEVILHCDWTSTLFYLS